MKAIMKRVPVRIQLWLDEGLRIDVRGWLDEFDADTDWQPMTDVRDPMVAKQYSVTVHTNGLDRPWKFERGKPQGVR